MAQRKAMKPACPECTRLMDSPQLPRRITVLDKDIVLKVSDVLEEPERLGKQAKKRVRKTKVNEFLKNLNAVLNHGGGLIVVHVQNPYKLDTFEQSVNYHMANLIPDESPFHENFERHIVGRKHLIYRVIPNERQLSTVLFNTKVPQSCGVVDPTQGQMRYLMKHQGDQHKAPLYEQVGYTFRENTIVEVKVQKVDRGKAGTPKDSVFQEAINVQAKKVPDTAIEQFQSCLEKEFFNGDKLSTYLPKYVSAFTKLPQGGSIFLGIKEEKTTTPRWQEVDGEERDGVLVSLQGNLRLWKSDHSELYYIAEESQQTEVASGEYRCEGVKLEPGDEEAVSQEIKRLIKDNTHWLPNTEQPPVDVVQPPVDAVQKHVDVEYHRVEGNPELCVVEVKVKIYKGMVFHDKAGPQAYTIKGIDDGGYSELETLSLEKWSEKIKKQIQK